MMSPAQSKFSPIESLQDYKATVAKGIEEILAAELKEIGAKSIKPGKGVVQFSGNREILYRANLHSRTAMRIVMPLFSFTAKDEKSYYRQVHQYPWENLFSLEQTFAIDTASRSDVFRHSMYMSRLTKDGIVDRFRNRSGSRPSVDPKNPDFRIHVHIEKERCTLSLDSSGEALHRRGYRKQEVEAPLKETLAAALVLFSKWNGEGVFIDPMCGSGTIPVEAAWIGMRKAPGILRSHFGFMQWRDFQPGLWESIREEAIRSERALPGKIFALDLSNKSLKASRFNASLAGVEQIIEFRQADFFESSSPVACKAEFGDTTDDQTEDHGFCKVMINPPYDERLELDDRDLFYKKMGDVLKREYTGSTAWVFSGTSAGMRKIGLKASGKIPLYNGALESQLCRYELY